MTTYEQGLVERCNARGIDPQSLVKYAKSIDSDPLGARDIKLSKKAKSTGPGPAANYGTPLATQGGQQL